MRMCVWKGATSKPSQTCLDRRYHLDGLPYSLLGHNYAVANTCVHKKLDERVQLNFWGPSPPERDTYDKAQAHPSKPCQAMPCQPGFN